MAESTEPTKIPSAVVKRIMLEAGAQRVSADAVAELGKLLVQHGHHLTKGALGAAEHAKRTTIKADDFHLGGQ
jgi:DNA-binding protein